MQKKKMQSETVCPLYIVVVYLPQIHVLRTMLYLCNSANIPEADSLLKERDISEYDLS